MYVLRVSISLALLVITISTGAVAQQSVDLASVSGRVVDPSGAAVRDAHVTARHLLTNVTSSTTVDAGGRFRFPYLRIGSYEITVGSPGFEDVVRKVTLGPGSAFDLPVSLQVRGLEVVVGVTAESSLLESARSQIASTLGGGEVQALPMNGRSFVELALFTPGVAPANVGSTQLFPETSAVPGVSLSVGSQRNLSNNFVVDGLSANDDAAGLSGIPYGLDALEQFQVVTSGAQAELGRALGGYINAVTRSGTNVLHGTGYLFVRDDRLNARNPLLGTTLPMDQWQYGGSLGGPVIRNRTFYFGNIEQRRLDQTGLVTILDASVALINSQLDSVGYPGPRIATGIYPNPVHSTNLFARLDHQVNSRDQLSVRFSLYDVQAENARGAGGLNAASASSSLDSVDRSLSFSNTLAFGARTALETRAQLTHSDLRAPATDPIGPTVAISGVASFGTSSTSPTRRANTLLQVVNNLSHHARNHAVRAGVDFLFNDDTITFPRTVRGGYSFSSLTNFLRGTYNNAGFTQTFGLSEVGQANPNLGMYAQDEWKATSALTVNLGVRYDLQFLETIDVDRDNISPRVGIVWSPSASRRTLVRGGVGIFYDRVPLRPLANALLSAGNTTDLNQLRQVAVRLSPTQANAPVFPAILPGVVPSGTLVNFTTMDRRLQNAHSTQLGAEVEREIGPQTTVTLGYQYVNGSGLLMAVNQNAPMCVATGTNNGCRPNPAYGDNTQYSSVGESRYHGLYVSLARRPSGWGHYRVAYSVSKSRNNLGEFFFSSPIDPLDLSKDWGRSDDDQRHRLTMNAAVQTPTSPATTTAQRLTYGFQLSAAVQVYSALPMNITSGVTTVQGTQGRPLVDGEFIERNSGKGNDYLTVNLRLSRGFPMRASVRGEVLLEGFNLTNRQNVVVRNGNFGAGTYPDSPSPTFNQVLAVSDPRVFQIGVRIRF